MAENEDLHPKTVPWCLYIALAAMAAIHIRKSME